MYEYVKKNIMGVSKQIVDSLTSLSTCLPAVSRLLAI